MINVTGYSGRFPGSRDIHDFWNKLKEGIDMVEKAKRYPEGYYGLPHRAGNLYEINRFDASFFKFNMKQTTGLDPQVRMLLECTMESLQDAQISISGLRGSRTGVYIGCCFSDYHAWLLIHDPENINGYENVGSAISMTANKISHFFGFTGPSMAIDTACSSSLVAMDMAVRDLRSGRVDHAVVGGVSLTLRPSISKSFAKYNMLSPTGTCHSFSGDADGYCRSEAVGVLFLEKTSNRGYVTIVGSGVNSDGYTSEGITFPSCVQQESLMKDVLRECNVCPDDIEYIEAHGTGTAAGDGVELAALDAVYGSQDKVVAIGSIKSNIGHAEGASGMMAMIKLMMCYEHGVLVPNLHYTLPIHESVTSGRFEVVTSLRSWNRGYAAISNFGFGGTSAHVVLKCGPYDYSDSSNVRFVYGRTKDMHVGSPPTYKNIRMYKYRGIIESGQLVKSNRISKHRPPVCWVISGQGSNWLNMGKDLIEVPEFCSLLSRLGKWTDIDLYELFRAGSHWLNKSFSTIGICTIQLFLINHLRSLGQSFDFVIGHSMGEICAAYADGALTEEQVIKLADVRSNLATLIPHGFVIRREDGDLKDARVVCRTGNVTVFEIEDAGMTEAVDMRGSMVVIGAHEEFVRPFLRPMTVIACYNSPNGLTLSGPKCAIDKVVNDILRERPDTFVRPIDTDGVAYHSPTLAPFKDLIQDAISSIIPFGTMRSGRWFTTSDGGDMSDVGYHTNNIISPVRFCEAINKLPADTLVMEIGPSGSLLSQVKRTRKDVVTIASLERDRPSSLENIADRLWLNGVLLDHEDSDDHLAFPHRHNHSWDHETEYFIPSYKDFESHSKKNVTYDLKGKHRFLLDHVIDNREVFPATGHIYTVWKHIIGLQKSVRISDFRIHRAVLLGGLEFVKFIVEQAGEQFVISYDGEEVASGQITVTKQHEQFIGDGGKYHEYVDRNALYSFLARMGYHYKSSFQLIRKQSVDGSKSDVDAGAHIIAYLDNLLQCCLDGEMSCLRLPTSIQEIVVSNVATRGGMVVFNKDSRTISANGMLFRGIHTTPAPTQQSEQLTHLVSRFVAYGETYIPNPDNRMYGQKIQNVVVASLTEEIVKMFPWLQNVLDLHTNGVDNKQREDFPLLAAVENMCCTMVDTVKTPMTSIGTLCGDDPFGAPAQEWMEHVFGIVRNEISVVKMFELGTCLGPVGYLKESIKSYYSTNSDTKEAKTIKYDINTSPSLKSTYNLIVASNILYLAENVQTTLNNMITTLEPDGMLVLHEFISSVPCFVWGLHHSAWEISQDDRKFGLWMSLEQWREVFRSTGLVVVKMIHDDDCMLVLLKQRSEFMGTVCRTWQEVHSVKNEKIHFVDSGGSFGFVRTLLKEGYDIHAWENDVVDDGLQMRFNSETAGTRGTYILQPLQPSPRSQKGNHRLVIRKPGNLGTLEWISCPEEELIVAVSALNFKDVMYAYGKLKLVKPSFGLEFSGYLGSERYMGFGSEGCIAQRVKKELCWKVPDSMTMEEAATIPVVYSTVYYALFHKAQLEPGQSVLIHAGAGGIGNAALNICLKRGIHVFTTCSESKREHLKTKFGLLDNQIGDSRSVSFRDLILKETGGSGVDCVLNSLSGELLDASLEVLKPFGNFCEIGKFDLMNDTKVGIRCFSENVSYHAIDLSSMVKHPGMSRVLYDLVQDGIERDEVLPLAYQSFAKDKVEDALRLMAGGHHSGKVLVNMRDVPVNVVPLFMTSGTHVITGGLGGFGLELAHWLYECGADKLVLTSRSVPKTGHQIRRLSALKKKCEVIVSHLDVVDIDQCTELVEMFRSNLKGV